MTEVWLKALHIRLKNSFSVGTEELKLQGLDREKRKQRIKADNRRLNMII